jgi:hypothetical protein
MCDSQSGTTLSGGTRRLGVSGPAGGVPNPETAQWEVPASTVGLVTRLLRAGEDEVTQHYAVKAIENIVTHGGDWAQRFTSQVPHPFCNSTLSSNRHAANLRRHCLRS